jgi:uncharacterized ion transporter superfamily protein YfcC
MERPTLVSACGILNIGFAAGRLVRLLLYIPFHARAVAHSASYTRRLQEHPFYAFWIHATIPLGLLSFVLLLVSGIGLLRMHPWARKLSIGYGVYGIVGGAAATVINFIFVVLPLFAKASFTDYGYIAPTALGAEIGTVILGLSALIYPVILIVFMTRPHIAAAFRAGAERSGVPSVS